MEAISAPWRMAYIGGTKAEGCVLCREDNTCENYMLRDGKHAFVLMNLYPYTTGHLMVAPTRHVGILEELRSEERTAIFDLVVFAVEALKRAIKPDGFNIGVNLGHAAGAGIEEHLHIHIVPRWNGDTNFMSVVGDVRVIPEDITKTRDKLLPYFKDVTRGE